MIKYGSSPEEYLNSVSFQRRIKTVFSAMNIVNDETLGLDDYMAYARGMIAMQKDDKNNEQIIANCRELYTIVVCNGVPGNDDVRVTYEQVLANVAKAYVNREAAGAALAKFANLIFDMIDTDHDGFITKEEFRKFHEALFGGRVSTDVSDVAFAAIDSNANGVISPQELEHAVVRYNLEVGGNDESMPLIYGPLVQV